MSRGKVLLMAVPGVLVVAVVAALLTGSGEPGAGPAGQVASTPTVIQPTTQPTTKQPPAAPLTEEQFLAPGKPQAPPTGAYIGAWVQPTPYSQAGRVDGVRSFEKSIDRKLDIVGLYRKVGDPFPTESDLALSKTAVLQLSWASPDVREVLAGKHDKLIRAKAVAVKEFAKPVLLRWRWEMDRPNLGSVVHEPTDFVLAWQRVRKIFDDAGAKNVAWVWCPTAQGFADGTAPLYYPGDNQVDWLCADVYPTSPWVKGSFSSFGSLAGPFVEWAATHPKPILIGEYGVAQSYGPKRSAWLQDMAAYVRNTPQIKGLVYYAESRPESPDYYRFHLKGDKTATAALTHIASQPYFNPLQRTP
ncbi:MAG TPA: hypothetical protein VGD34_12380 [Kribbella sp.]